MSEAVWVSNAYSDTSLVKPFNPENFARDKGAVTDLAIRHTRGETLGSNDFPKTFVCKYRDKKMGRQPDFFAAGSFWCVSSRFADVLRDFDLGGGGLYPVRLQQYDRETPVEGSYFGLDLGSQKRCISEARSRLQILGAGVPPAVPADHHDDDIAVTEDALLGADLWTDPGLFKCLFFSDRLATALKRQKLAARLKLKRCRIVSI
ncbi:imm11 family protein [Salinarimonas rosea]|uniref:imm11 family protein n=1 Tax=Salinarimonas rosea TaxID=552063 RepID=UPI00048C5BC2|nr:DUF1629 domain-containing protein [Salinarimonas rosea]